MIFATNHYKCLVNTSTKRYYKDIMNLLCLTNIEILAHSLTIMNSWGIHNYQTPVRYNATTSFKHSLLTLSGEDTCVEVG